jgi:hypothetical protein
MKLELNFYCFIVKIHICRELLELVFENFFDMVNILRHKEKKTFLGLCSVYLCYD